MRVRAHNACFTTARLPLCPCAATLVHQKLPKIKSHFFVITHNRDRGIPGRIGERLLSSPKLLKWCALQPQHHGPCTALRQNGVLIAGQRTTLFPRPCASMAPSAGAWGAPPPSPFHWVGRSLGHPLQRGSGAGLGQGDSTQPRGQGHSNEVPRNALAGGRRRMGVFQSGYWPIAPPPSMITPPILPPPPSMITPPLTPPP